jgi:hypothetical protein
MLERHEKFARPISDRDGDTALAAMTGHVDKSIGHQLADKS